MQDCLTGVIQMNSHSFACLVHFVLADVKTVIQNPDDKTTGLRPLEKVGQVQRTSATVW